MAGLLRLGRPPLLRIALACSVVVLVAPATALAQPPSHAYLTFKVPSTMTQVNPATQSTRIPMLLHWSPAASQAAGVGCCTNRIFDNGSFLGATTANTFQVSTHVGGYEIGPYRIKSWDADGTFLGSVLADPAFANAFEDSYLTDYGGRTCAPWRSMRDTEDAYGSACATNDAGASLYFPGYIDAAWIATTGPQYGSAAVYINGVYVTTVSLYAKTVHHRQVVWAHRFGQALGTVTLINLATPGHPKIDIDAVVNVETD